jgi:hypothetical protein
MSEYAVNRAPMRQQIASLRQGIEAAAPLLSLLRQLEDLEKTRKQWQAAEGRRLLLLRASVAATKFMRFPDLVHHQVAGLIQDLEAKTKEWLERIYKPHYIGGPAYVGIDPSQERGVGLHAGMGHLGVPAHQVMNSSQLRACVWAFLFSLWERIRERSGGLNVMLLDDPQTQFDPINIENLAASVTRMVSSGMTPIITSNDSRFIAAIRDKLPRVSTGLPSWTTLQMSPISSSRLTATLSPSVEEVFERRDACVADENDIAKAQEFVGRVRVHIENRLWDLLASDPMLIYRPTLTDLIGFLSNARNSGERPFNEEPFRKLLALNALKPTAPFYKIINKAHHDLRNVTPQEAQEIILPLDEVHRLVRSCTAAYARFMGRLTREDEELFYAEPPSLPTPVRVIDKEVRVIGDFSARSYADALALEREATVFSFQSLGEVALFGIRSSSLGTLALVGQVVIASTTLEAKTGDPVIALFGSKVLARRYHVDAGDPARVTLVCDVSGSENVAPAQMIPKRKVRVMPVVGVLYDTLGQGGAGEAIVVENCSLLSKRLFAARIVDDSAYPVIRNGDRVLLEDMIVSSNAALEAMKHDMVAFEASRNGESFAYLKRVGAAISGSMRIFENVGIIGDALPVQVSDPVIEIKGETLQLRKMWRVHGVLRTMK